MWKIKQELLLSTNNRKKTFFSVFSMDMNIKLSRIIRYVTKEREKKFWTKPMQVFIYNSVMFGSRLADMNSIYDTVPHTVVLKLSCKMMNQPQFEIVTESYIGKEIDSLFDKKENETDWITSHCLSTSLRVLL